MIYVAIGMAGFLAAYLFDVVSIKRIPRLKGLVWLVAVVLVVCSTWMVCFDPVKFTLPAWASILGWVLLPTFILCFIYSLFINLPFRKTYVKTGVGSQLIRTGTYALVRHPGVLWYGVILIALILISKSQLILIAAPIWFVMDVIHVTIQDKFLFGKMFPEYKDYRKETPMLIPNTRSIAAFFKTFNSPKAKEKVLEDTGGVK
jgi:protein-S-isoprenylcysteine O-methyltransferase Ste14